jgi:hypothetical protein
MSRRRVLGGLAMAGLAAGVAALPSAARAAGAAMASAMPTDAFEVALSRHLATHVRWNAAGTASAVDYAGLRRDRAALRRLQDDTSRVTRGDFDGWSLPARQAFLVNAYNVWTLALIAAAPAGTASIKDLGGFLQSPWKKAFIPFLGETRSLDDLEHDLLRGAPGFAEPRIHFAVNCASIGCPALRPEAYTAALWDAQLDDQTRRFLRDRPRNRVLGREPLRLGVSSIFDWYGEDFDAAGGVPGFLARYPESLGLTPDDAAALRRGDARIDFLDYDWRLNDRTLD